VSLSRRSMTGGLRNELQYLVTAQREAGPPGLSNRERERGGITDIANR